MDPNTSTGDGIGAAVVVVMVLFYLAIIGFAVYMVLRVAKKAGYSPWYGLLYFIPLVNFVVLVMFVFSKWPIEREVEELRTQVWAAQGRALAAGQPGYGAPSRFGAPPAYEAPAYGGSPGYGETTSYGTQTGYPGQPGLGEQPRHPGFGQAPGPYGQ
ncbi:hypothetical protein ACTHAM_001903 [Cellulomonas soli]|uniref:hypothetical protein n=1 Tax=Cellulomonas soli TaxID=931535 RepID=UPI003F8556EB